MLHDIIHVSLWGGKVDVVGDWVREATSDGNGIGWVFRCVSLACMPVSLTPVSRDLFSAWHKTPP